MPVHCYKPIIFLFFSWLRSWKIPYFQIFISYVQKTKSEKYDYLKVKQAFSFTLTPLFVTSASAVKTNGKYARKSDWITSTHTHTHTYYTWGPPSWNHSLSGNLVYVNERLKRIGDLYRICVCSVYFILMTSKPINEVCGQIYMEIIFCSKIFRFSSNNIFGLEIEM